MKIKTKIFIVFFLAVFVPVILFLFNIISKEEAITQNFLKEKTEILSYALDATINSKEDLQNKAKLQNIIYKFLWLFPDIVKISIAIPVEDKFQIIASNKINEIGDFEDQNVSIAFSQDTILFQNLPFSANETIFNAICPIHLGGERVGVYNIFLLLNKEKKIFEERRRELIIIILALLAAILFFSLYFLNYLIINPIKQIKEKCHLVSLGNFNLKLDIKRKDEIGDLAAHFNTMAEKLQEIYKGLEEKIAQRTMELEEAKTVLEIKVKARTRELRELNESLEEKIKERTKELQEKMADLERFNRLAVGRELKMIELKKEIERLKAQLREKDKI